MHILVVDNSESNLISATRTLTGHDLTNCGGTDEAIELIYNGPHDEDIFEGIMAGRGFLRDPGYYVKEYEEARAEAEKASELPYWEVVLCDLIMPPPLREARSRVSRHFENQEMIVGWSLALQAIRRGAKYAGVATNLNHHDHPGSALLDGLGGYGNNFDDRKPPQFVVNGAVLGFYNNVPVVRISEQSCLVCQGSGHTEMNPCCAGCDGTGEESGKDWGKVLTHLTKKAE